MDGDDMARERNVGAGPREAPRRSPWTVGLMLLVVTVVIVVGAIVLDRHLRPLVGIEPAPTPASMAGAPASPSVTASTPAATTPAASSTVQAADGATPTPSPTGLPVATSPLEREIENTYQRYLEIYGDAVLNLDATHLSEVLDGEALQLVTAEVNDLKAQGRRVKIIEDNRLIALSGVTDTGATLIDEYTSRSVFVDPTTNQPLPRTDTPTRIRQSYEFRKVDDAWKIVDGTREVLGEATP